MAVNRVQHGIGSIKPGGIHSSADFAGFMALLDKGWPATIPNFFSDNHWWGLSEMLQRHSECFATVAELFTREEERRQLAQDLKIPLELIDRNTQTALNVIQRDIGIIRLHISRESGNLFADLLPGVRAS